MPEDTPGTCRISVVVPTHNRVELLKGALRSLLEAGGLGPRDEIVVVANACTDDTVAAAEKIRESCSVRLRVCEEEIPSLNVARNRGAEAASGDVLAFVDDDVLVQADWARAIRVIFDEHRARLGTGPVELCWERVERPEWLTPRASKLLTRLDLGPELRPADSPNHYVGANLLVRADLWRDLGGFRDGLDRSGADLLSGGDTEFVKRALEGGAKGVYHPDARVLHVVTTGRVSLEYLAAVAEARGRTRVALSRLGTCHNPWLMARYGLTQMVVGTAWRALGTLFADSGKRVDGRIVANRGLGTLRALVHRG